MTEAQKDIAARRTNAVGAASAIDHRTTPVVGKVYDTLLWFVPVVARFRRDAKYTLGERLIVVLRGFLGRVPVLRLPALA